MSRGAEDAFAANVRPTDPLSPVEQRATFDVPDGFEVQLVAHEPDVHKPMNLAFDAAGRLWVTTSREYPTPVPVGQPGRDRVMIFEDFGPDGRARKITTFADGLNIPIGVYPFRTDTTGWKAIVWSIPHVWLMEDTDGDARADSRRPLYGPFDHTRDTHGNQASFRRGFDGWLYATHGYNNDSHVAGGDGHRVDLHSGNTYRIRLDGSRIEPFTKGQVNPFGLAFDPRGDLFSSDCHSDPIYLLLPDGNYPSFGKPHDGLGFAPNTMERLRGSTAIDGISYYADDLWPQEYRDCVFVGDVMTSRVYRDFVADRGSGRVTRARPDFMVGRDPWFRPVDTTFGPDGALYVADFYNRIIGHYEVPLSHPGRDRERGRIWRVVHRGQPLRAPALAQDADGLVRELGSPSLSRRLLATQEIADRLGGGSAPLLEAALARTRNAWQHVHALWLLYRLERLPAALWREAATTGDPLVRIHANRIAFDVLTEAARANRASSPEARAAIEVARRALSDPIPAVQRAGIEALARLPEAELLPEILEFVSKLPEEDPFLRYSARRALRNLLARDAAVLSSLESRADLPAVHARAILDVCLAIPSETSARFVLRHRRLNGADAEWSRLALAHVARHAAPSEIDRLVESMSNDPTLDLDFRTELFKALRQGFARRGIELGGVVRRWGSELARSLLTSIAASSDWLGFPDDHSPRGVLPWDFQARPASDGRKVEMLSSHPHGEHLTGTIRSRPFPAPARLDFSLAGHDGPPGKPPGKRNVARLRSALTGAVLAEAFAPGHDTAQPVQWDLSASRDASVVFEVRDGDAGSAFAWIAFGRIDPSPVPWPTVSPSTLVARQIAAAEIAAAVEDTTLRPDLAALAVNREANPTARAAAFRIGAETPLARAAAELVADDSLPASWRSRVADVLFGEDRSGAEALIADTWKEAPQRFQARLAGLAASSSRLASNLVARMAQGAAPIGLLQDRRLRERLEEASPNETRQTIKRLLQSLPDEDQAVRRLLAERLLAYRSRIPDRQRGKEVFAVACAACHQIDGTGGLVGPQLNGIGTRGEERLVEDILAPNRNVDHAFWTTTLDLKDGETVSGLFRREDGELLILANAAGAEFSVRKAEVASRKESGISIMPSNFGEAIPAEDLDNLIGYLANLRGNP